VNDWNQFVDAYCERLEPGFWGEPLNAVTNLAFIVAAAVAWRGLGNRSMPIARLLAVLLLGIGIGSFLFHTFATRWSASLDVLFIALFVIVYFHAANRYYLAMRPIPAILMLALLFVYIPAAGWLISVLLPFIGGSSVYAGIALLIMIYGVVLWKRMPDVSRGLLAGAGILCVSISFRMLDDPLCSMIPTGTHFMWHLLNAVMLAWMIFVLRNRLDISREMIS